MGRYIKKPPKVSKFPHLVFNFPDSASLQKNTAGVYKISFDDKWFYIGSSVNLKGRFITWSSTIKYNHGLPFNITNILESITNISFSIVEYCEIKESARIREDFHIKDNFDHPKCLNHCPSSFGLKGKVKYKGYVKPQKAKLPPTQPKKVAMIDKCGNIIKVYPSVSSAERDGYSASDVINKKSITSKGFLFRVINDDGSIVHFEKKRNKWSRVFTEEEREQCRVRSKKAMDNLRGSEKWSRIEHTERMIKVQSEKNGVVLTFRSIADAARGLNVDSSNITKVLKGKRNTHNGYVFRYA